MKEPTDTSRLKAQDPASVSESAEKCSGVASEVKPETSDTLPGSESVSKKGGPESRGDPESLNSAQALSMPTQSKVQSSPLGGFARWLTQVRYGIPVFLLLAVGAFVGVAYACWGLLLGQILDWANADGHGWRWLLAWWPVIIFGIGPVYVLIGAGAVLLRAINIIGESSEKRELDELDIVEEEIRGSSDPVDYARYSRKALRAYYVMGQNQVRLSFYVGVAAMLFGFVFLVTGLALQAVDTTQVELLRDTQDISLIAIGGGLIIEFIAATFLWIYRTAIVQLNLYFRRQTLIHSALLSVAVARDMEGDEFDLALREIISTLVAPGEELTVPELPESRSVEDKAGQG